MAISSAYFFFKHLPTLMVCGRKDKAIFLIFGQFEK